QEAGRLTLYSQAAGQWHLDGLMNRTFQFGHRVLGGLESFPVGEPYRELIRRGADLILMEVIARSSDYFSEPYVREIEAHAPFRFSFLVQKRQEFFDRHGSFIHLLETAMTIPS